MKWIVKPDNVPSYAAPMDGWAEIAGATGNNAEVNAIWSYQSKSSSGSRSIYLNTEPVVTEVSGSRRYFFDAVSVSPVETAIRDARWILRLEGDWDGDGSIAYDVRTWRKATNFLYQMQQDIGVESFEAPSIMPGPLGSIDLHWRTDKFELLINVPVKGDARFYGDDYADRKIEGELPGSQYDNLLTTWLNSVV